MTADAGVGGEEDEERPLGEAVVVVVVAVGVVVIVGVHHAEGVAAEAAAQAPEHVDGAEAHQQDVGEALQAAADQVDDAEAGEERDDPERGGGCDVAESAQDRRARRAQRAPVARPAPARRTASSGRARPCAASRRPPRSGPA